MLYTMFSVKIVEIIFGSKLLLTRFVSRFIYNIFVFQSLQPTDRPFQRQYMSFGMSFMQSNELLYRPICTRIEFVQQILV